MKKITIVFSFLLVLYNAEAQKSPFFSPFKGFHVGITAQAEFIQKCSFVALTNADMIPKGRWNVGWEAGMEFSYHFAKYFGISAGINYGTALSYNCSIFLLPIPGIIDDFGIADNYEPLYFLYEHEIMFPVKFEFHYPLAKNFFFTAETGIKIKGFLDKISGNDYISYGGGFNISIYHPDDDIYERIPYFRYEGERDVSKMRCELLVGMGLYYKLRYGDLLRFTAGVNLSFKNIVEGVYLYYISESLGTFAVKNDFIYTQISYIHTLNYQKAKKYLKKQEHKP